VGLGDGEHEEGGAGEDRAKQATEWTRGKRNVNRGRTEEDDIRKRRFYRQREPAAERTPREPHRSVAT
jgi:hypothetical protein